MKKWLIQSVGLGLLATLILSACGRKEKPEELREESKTAWENKVSAEERELVRQVDSLLAQDKLEEALRIFDEAIIKYPRSLFLRKAQIETVLKSGRADLAMVAFNALQANYEKAKEILLEATRSKDNKVHITALQTIGATMQPWALEPLLAAAKAGDHEIRRVAISLLPAYREDARVFSLVLAALKDEHWFVRTEAAGALGKLRDPRAVEPLFEAIKDSDATAAYAAENSLLVLVEHSERKPFADRLNHSDPAVVRVAAVALSAVRDPRVTPILIKFAQQGGASERARAIRALGLGQDPNALPTLRKLLLDKEMEVRAEACIAIGLHRDLQSLNALERIYKNPTESEQVKSAASIALGNIGRELIRRYNEQKQKQSADGKKGVQPAAKPAPKKK